eukprot:scaffold25842_cov198-Amphora_coffeaeformis.AAC.45
MSHQESNRSFQETAANKNGTQSSHLDNRFVFHQERDSVLAYLLAAEAQQVRRDTQQGPRISTFFLDPNSLHLTQHEVIYDPAPSARRPISRTRLAKVMDVATKILDGFDFPEDLTSAAISE